MSTPSMSLGEAWVILGRDPAVVMGTLKKAVGIDARVEAAEKAFSKAQKIARVLMAQYHPDKNPGNPGSAEQFRRVNMALESIEYHTEELKKRAVEAKQKLENKSASFIEIIK